MNYVLEVTNDAESDIQESIYWYESEQHNLGKEFLSVIERTFLEIRLSPYSKQVYYKDFRKAKTAKFKFSIIYKITDNKIIVFAVYHDSRNPTKLIKRLNH